MTEEHTILVVDDTKSNLNMLAGLLSDYDVLMARDGESGIEIANEEAIDLILLDIMMPGIDGYETCKILKESDKTKDIPIIFLTSMTDEVSIKKAYDVGGMDYVTKPFKVEELLARVKTQLKIKSLINDLEFMAFHDPMTGAYNRRKFFELGYDKINNNKENLFAVMLDIDKFKNVNDTYGHSTGDEVIKAVVNTIINSIEEDKVFGRLGGEEFAIVGNYKDKESVIQNTEEVRQAIEKLEVISETNTIKFTISSGISQYSASDKDNVESLDYLLAKADEALYEAKETGRNKVVFRN